MPRVFFRADGNEKIGLGHIMRCLALAEMLQTHFECVFLIQAPSVLLKQQIEASGSFVISLPQQEVDANEVTEELSKHITSQDMIILDGYTFQTAYQKALKNLSIKVVCIDDIPNGLYYADAIINHTGGFSSTDYKTAQPAHFYLGPQYALLRTNFLAAKRSIPHIFICFGGADPENYTMQMLQTCFTHHARSVLEVVIGSANQHQQQLSDLQQIHSNLHIHYNLSAQEMVELMARCDIGITSASTIAYEYLSTGGRLFVIQTASNQKHLFQFLVSEGLAEEGTISNLNKALNPSNKIATLFDGQQAKRLRQVFFDLSIKIQQANLNDAQALYNWANDPITRSQSFSTEPIVWDQHLTWFQRKLNDPQSDLLIAWFGEEAIGQVRFDHRTDYTLISYGLAPKYRGHGLGYSILRLAIDWLTTRRNTKNLWGYVKLSNPASMRAFEKLAFERNHTTDYPETYLYTLNLK
ncbi:MAG: UDP-2,4-diacetamido-2,4,6-trideoxy-beta-L-altropyranose hydrolase [Bacteroidetes Order II. Incertae sedis bacterium]|nr:UDP-2,4-diacetamido-2,4,6-trideoxy-beta-L-altropyranose hydrolase [Bacteroidetes Order II. bacterium]